MTQHFSAAEWFEFARDPASPRRNALIKRHLDEGCAECRQRSSMWTQLLEITGREPGYTPPDSVVRAAQAAFGSERSWKWLHEIAEVARVISDSIRGLAPSAVRGSLVSNRQLLNASMPYMIDVRYECECALRRVRLNGQVLNSNQPSQDVVGVEVFLLRGENLANRTQTNVFGEFDLDFQDEEGLQLFIEIRGQKVIEILLPTPLVDRKEGIGEA